MKRIIYIILSLAFIIQFLCPSAFAISKRVYRDDIVQLADTILFFDNSEPKEKNTVEICFSFPGKNEGVFAKERKLSFVWNYISEDNFYSAIFEQCSDHMDDMIDTRYVRLTIRQVSSGKVIDIADMKINKDVGLGPEENVAILSLTERIAEVGIGHRKPTVVWRGDISNDLYYPVGIRAFGAINVTEIVEEYIKDIKKELTTDITETKITSSPEKEKYNGIWLPLDRNTDSNYAKAGGRYRLGLIEDMENPGNYLIIYLSGAEVNSKNWNEGMIKGMLIATPFKNHFDLVWYDSEMEKIDKDCHADISEESILTLNFPMMKSSMRFYKE